MKATKKQIDDFFSEKGIAIAGISRDPKKFSRVVYKELKQKNYKLYPINPSADSIEGDSCFASVKDLPEEVRSLLILTPKEKTDAVLEQAIAKGIQNIWVQQQSETKESMRIAEEYQKEVIFNKCVFMFAEPVKGVHKFHHTLTKLFGGIPK